MHLGSWGKRDSGVSWTRVPQIHDASRGGGSGRRGVGVGGRQRSDGRWPWGLDMVDDVHGKDCPRALGGAVPRRGVSDVRRGLREHRRRH